MKKSLFILCSILILTALFAGCSMIKPKAHAVEPVAQASQPKQEGVLLPVDSKTEYPVINAPVWLAYLPEGENVIGISYAQDKKPKSIFAESRIFAADCFAKLNAKYSTSKPDFMIQYDKNDVVPVTDEIVVSPAIDYALQNNAIAKLNPLGETAYMSYQINLFGMNEAELSTDIIPMSVGTIPKWCKDTNAFEDDEYIYTVGYAEDASLINAWKKAQDTGLNRIAQYRLMKAVPALRSAGNYTEKTAVIDDALKAPNSSLSKSWLFPKILNGVTTYNVFLMFKARKIQ